MIIYQASKDAFVRQAFNEGIEGVLERHFRSATGRGVGTSELTSWKHSLLEMARVLVDEEIPADAGIAIEYQLPQSSKRIDFVIVGEDDDANAKIVIVELKQWSESRRSDKDALIWARRGGKTAEREGTHPSYQAWSYAAYLQDFNATVQDLSVVVQPCAYLHNHPRDGEIDHPHYREHLERAPLFLAQESAKLQTFIRRHVRRGDRRGTLYAIDNGRIRPSKSLIDSVVSLVQGRTEFILIDDQKVVFETVLATEAKATEHKQVVIIHGGPGTGKSVIAINLLGALIKHGRNARYVSKNTAPRAVYEARLAGTFKKTRISNLFSGSGAFVGEEADAYDTLIVDEAHRLVLQGGLYGNVGENQVMELIHAARCTVFFVDDDQRVTLRDIGSADELRNRARLAGCELTELRLTSQFRCNGSDGYLSWLDAALEVRGEADRKLDTSEYDFRVLDSPNQVHELIELKNRHNNRSRVVAGYCWKWPSKRDPLAWDIVIPQHGYRRRWNLDKDGSLWLVTPGSEEQVGCIHTCQGLELDYVGVIVGPDLLWRDDRVVTDVSKRAASDKSIKGWKKLSETDPSEAKRMADLIVKNTYRTLMTRGLKGCFVYCTDEALAAHLRSLVEVEATASQVSAPSGVFEASRTNVFPLRRISKHLRSDKAGLAPIVDLRFAAGVFSETQALEDYAEEWAVLPEWVRPQAGLFVAQVVGESMNRRIPNGAWCLFRASPSGTRQGKVVVVQHRDISDPETGGRYTVKRYASQKAPEEDGSWKHVRITLTPDSDRPEFIPIILTVADHEETYTVVAEFLLVL